jgi:hypothetical protein
VKRGGVERFLHAAIPSKRNSGFQAMDGGHAGIVKLV